MPEPVGSASLKLFSGVRSAGNCENLKPEILHHFISRHRTLAGRGKYIYIVTFTISLYATNAKMRMQVLLCFFQMLPIYLTWQKSRLLSRCLLHHLQLAIYSPMGSCTAELHESRNGRALRAPRLPQQLCSRTCTGAGKRSNSQGWCEAAV